MICYDSRCYVMLHVFHCCVVLLCCIALHYICCVVLLCVWVLYLQHTVYPPIADIFMKVGGVEAAITIISGAKYHSSLAECERGCHTLANFIFSEGVQCFFFFFLNLSTFFLIIYIHIEFAKHIVSCGGLEAVRNILHDKGSSYQKPDWCVVLYACV